METLSRGSPGHKATSKLTLLRGLCPWKSDFDRDQPRWDEAWDPGPLPSSSQSSSSSLSEGSRRRHGEHASGGHAFASKNRASANGVFVLVGLLVGENTGRSFDVAPLILSFTMALRQICKV